MIKLASDLNTELFAHRQYKECKKKKLILVALLQFEHSLKV